MRLLERSASAPFSPSSHPDAHPQAKAIAIEWLGILGSASSVPALVKARENPALAAPVAAALERIPGPEAKMAGARNRKNALPRPASAAEVAAFSTALGKGNDDDLIAAALELTERSSRRCRPPPAPHRGRLRCIVRQAAGQHRQISSAPPSHAMRGPRHPPGSGEGTA